MLLSFRGRLRGKAEKKLQSGGICVIITEKQSVGVTFQNEKIAYYAFLHLRRDSFRLAGRTSFEGGQLALVAGLRNGFRHHLAVRA